MKRQEGTEKTIDKEKSFLEYEAYDGSIWHKEYYDDKSGGYVVVDNGRIEHSKSSKRCGQIYARELAMSKVFASNGHRVVLLSESSTESSCDVLIDGLKGDLKRTEGVGNIVKYAKKAVRKQGAEIVLFQFDKMNADVKDRLLYLSSKENIHGMYFVTGENKIHGF